MNISLNNLKLVVLTVLAFTQTSCDEILGKQDNYESYGISGSAKSRVNIYKSESQLLLKASENNLDILKLCKDINAADTLDRVKSLTEVIEKVHLQIAKNYEAIAEKKLISIPSYIEENTILNNEYPTSYSGSIEENLHFILNKTKTQMKLLDALGDITDNVDFKILVIKDSLQLNSNVGKLEITLNRMNERSIVSKDRLAL